jgi:hypothetical protein
MFRIRHKTADLQSSTGVNFRHYAVDWRFIPEPVLMDKDTLRATLVRLSNQAALAPGTRPLWRATLGRGPLHDVRRAGLLFIHVPKCGGTSVCSLLYGKNLPHYTAAFWHEIYGEAMGDLPSFALVREPLDRLISAYRMAVAGGTDLIAYSRYWRARVQPWLGSIESFVEALTDSHLARMDLPADLWPQSAYLSSEDGTLLVKDLFPIEQLSQAHPSPIDHYLGGRRPPRLNVSIGHAIPRTGRLEDLARQLYQADYGLYDALMSATGDASDAERFNDHGARRGVA